MCRRFISVCHSRNDECDGLVLMKEDMSDDGKVSKVRFGRSVICESNNKSVCGFYTMRNALERL